MPDSVEDAVARLNARRAGQSAASPSPNEPIDSVVSRLNARRGVQVATPAAEPAPPEEPGFWSRVANQLSGRVSDSAAPPAPAEVLPEIDKGILSGIVPGAFSGQQAMPPAGTPKAPDAVAFPQENGVDTYEDMIHQESDFGDQFQSRVQDAVAKAKGAFPRTSGMIEGAGEALSRNALRLYDNLRFAMQDEPVDPGVRSAAMPRKVGVASSINDIARVAGAFGAPFGAAADILDAAMPGARDPSKPYEFSAWDFIPARGAVTGFDALGRAPEAISETTGWSPQTSEAAFNTAMAVTPFMVKGLRGGARAARAGMALAEDAAVSRMARGMERFGEQFREANTAATREGLIEQGKPVPVEMWDTPNKAVYDSLRKAIEGEPKPVPVETPRPVVDPVQAEAVIAQRRADVLNAGQELPPELWSPENKRVYDALKATMDEPRVVPAEQAPPGAVARETIDGGLDYLHGGVPIGEMVRGAAKAYDAADSFLAENVTKPLSRKAKQFRDQALDALPAGVSEPTRAAMKHLVEGFTHHAREISPRFQSVTEQVRGHGEFGRRKGAKMRATLEGEMKRLNLTESQRAAVNEWGRAAKGVEKEWPAGVPEELKATMEAIDAERIKMGEERVKAGSMREGTFKQYDRYLPILYEAENIAKRHGRVKAMRWIDEHLANDSYAVHLNNADIAEVQALVDQMSAADPAFQTQNVTHKRTRVDKASDFRTKNGKVVPVDTDVTRVTVKFSDSPEGMQARERFMARLDAEQSLARDSVTTSDPIPAEIRADMGQITEPGRAVEQMFSAGYRALGHAEALNHLFGPEGLKGDAKGPWFSPEEAPGYAHVNEPWAGYKHRGKWLRQDIYDALGEEWTRQAPEVRQGIIGFAKGLHDGTTGGIKSNLIVWNPGTIARQVYSNPGFLHLAGLDPANPAVLPKIKRAAQIVLDPEHPLHQQAIKDGIFGGNVEQASWAVQEALRETPKGAYQRGKWLGQVLTNPARAFKAGRAVEGRLANAFSFADAVTRMTIYDDALSNGLGRLDAIAKTNEFTPNHQSLGPVPEALSKTVIGAPFSAFNYETMGVLARSAVNHPIRTATLFGAYALVEEAMQEKGVGMSDAEEAAMEKALGHGFVPIGRSKDGKVYAIDTRFTRITGDFMTTPRQPGQSVLGNTMENIGKATGLGDSLVVDLIRVFNNKDRYGRDITPKGMGELRSGLDKVAYLAEQLGPRIAKEGWRLGQAVTDTPQSSPLTELNEALGGRKVRRNTREAEDPGLVALRNLGLRVIEWDPKTQKKRYIEERERIGQELRGDTRKGVMGDFREFIDAMKAAEKDVPR